MTVFRAEMARCITVYVLGVDISAMLNQSLDDAQVASETGDVQRHTKVVRSGIDLRSEFDQDLNQRRVTLTRRKMKRRETIRIGTIHNFKHLIVLVEVLLGEREDFDNFSPVALIDLGPIVHLDFLDILFPVFLLLRLFAFAGVALDRLAHRHL